MFFEADQLEALFLCPSCTNRIDIPKLLPCGATICSKCATRLLSIDENYEKGAIMASGSDIEMAIKCPVCSLAHLITLNSGLPTQKLLLDLLTLKKTKVYRSDLYERTEGQLVEFHERLFKLKQLIHAPEVYLKEYTDALRAKINTKAQERIAQLNLFKERILAGVDSYQEECLKNLLSMNNSDKNKYKDLLDKCQQHYTAANKYLSKANTNEIDVENIYKVSLEMTTELHGELLNLEKCLLNTQRLDFIEQQTNEIIGTLEASIP